MKPTVGRIVHYYDAWCRLRPAIIVDADPLDGWTTLEVFGTDDERLVFAVRFDEGEETEPRTWRWPPRV